MYFEAVFSFYVLLYHFVGHSFFGLIAFGSFSDIIKRNFSLTLTKLNFYVDMSVWLFVGKQYYRLIVSTQSFPISTAPPSPSSSLQFAMILLSKISVPLDTEKPQFLF